MPEEQFFLQNREVIKIQTIYRLEKEKNRKRRTKRAQTVWAALFPEPTLGLKLMSGMTENPPNI